MNRYTVRYWKVALDLLTEIWLGAGAERGAVTAAANQVEALLSSDPGRHGTHEHEGLWKLDVAPLRVLFTIDEEARTVRVVRFSRLDLSPPNAQTNGVPPAAG